MSEPLKVAVAGLGRMGVIHALHAHELARETGACTLAALADLDTARARKCAADLGCDVPIFDSVDALAKSGICNATVVVTPTDCHRAHSSQLVAAWLRVLLVKPLTGTLYSDPDFSADLDRSSLHAV